MACNPTQLIEAAKCLCLTQQQTDAAFIGLNYDTWFLACIESGYGPYDLQSGSCGYVSVGGTFGDTLLITEQGTGCGFNSWCSLLAFFTLSGAIGLKHLVFQAQRIISTCGNSTPPAPEFLIQNNADLLDINLSSLLQLQRRRTTSNVSCQYRPVDPYPQLLVSVHDNAALLKIEASQLAYLVNVDWEIYDNASLNQFLIGSLGECYNATIDLHDCDALTYFSATIPVLRKSQIKLTYCAALVTVSLGGPLTLISNDITSTSDAAANPSEINVSYNNLLVNLSICSSYAGSNSLVDVGFKVTIRNNPVLTNLKAYFNQLGYAEVDILANATLANLVLSRLTSMLRSKFVLLLNPLLLTVSFPLLLQVKSGVDLGTGTPDGIHFQIEFCNSLNAVYFNSLVIVEHVSGATATMYIASNASLNWINLPNALFGDGCILIFSNNALFSAAVDHILARAVASPNYQSGTINLLGANNGAPGPQGVIDKATLQARGITVLTN